MDALDPFTDLHYRIGLAVWRIQAFEFVLVRCIALVLKMPESRAADEIAAVVEKLEKRTLGALFEELKKAKSSTAVSSFEQRVDRFLDERNWLVHRSWRENHVGLHPQKHAALMERIDAITHEASALQRYFGEIAEGWMREQGYTTEEIDAATVEKLREWCDSSDTA